MRFSCETTVTCTSKYNPSTKKWVNTITDEGENENYDNPTPEGPSTAELSQAKAVNFWQMLNVHCNKEGMDAIIADLGAELDVKTIGGEGYTTATAYTIKYDNKASLPFNNKDYPSAAAKKTRYDKFFTEQSSCADVIKCVPDPQPGGGGNDTDKNTGNDGTNPDDKYGAQSDGVSSNLFTYFRDNDDRILRVDLWYPVISDNSGKNTTPGDTDYNSTVRAKGTQFVFDESGTPEDELFTLENGVDKKPIAGGKDIKANPKMYFDKQINIFNARAMWASDKDKPHRWNIKWIYVVSMPNHVYDTFSGKDGGSSSGQTYYDMDVYCDMTLNSEGPEKAYFDNDVFPTTDYTPKQDFDDDENKWVGVSFVRATGE